MVIETVFFLVSRSSKKGSFFLVVRYLPPLLVVGPLVEDFFAASPRYVMSVAHNNQGCASRSDQKKKIGSVFKEKKPHPNHREKILHPYIYSQNQKSLKQCFIFNITSISLIWLWPIIKNKDSNVDFGGFCIRICSDRIRHLIENRIWVIWKYGTGSTLLVSISRQ